MMETRVLTRVLLALLFCANNAAAFMKLSPFKCGSHRLLETLSRSSASEESSAREYTVAEVKAMETLIMAMSLEPTDDSRRKRLASIFATELAKDDCRRFATLFDQVLAIVGDRIQVEAKKKALAQQMQQRGGPDEPEENRDQDNDDNDFMGMEKSPEEKQLWALVDMMVQSKIISKKAFGELGNSGTFK